MLRYHLRSNYSGNCLAATGCSSTFFAQTLELVPCTSQSFNIQWNYFEDSSSYSNREYGYLAIIENLCGVQACGSLCSDDSCKWSSPSDGGDIFALRNYVDDQCLHETAIGLQVTDDCLTANSWIYEKIPQENADVAVKVDNSCRSRAGLWSCSDCNECVHLHYCDTTASLYRAGYLCREWPYYNGGPPLTVNPKRSALEKKDIYCTDPRNANCQSWIQTKQAYEELAFGVCECNEYISNATSDYCERWSCIDTEITKCDLVKFEYDCGNYVDLGYNISYYDKCCYELVFEDTTTIETYTKDTHDEYINCECLLTSSRPNSKYPDVKYCDYWFCNDYHGDYIEYENHYCTSRSPEGYCEVEEWTTDNYHKFENTYCECVTEDIDVETRHAYCYKYECEERGMLKYRPNVELAAVGFSFGLPFLVAVFGAYDGCDDCPCWFLFFRSFCAISVLGFSLMIIAFGGLGFFVISQCIYIFVVIVVLYYCYCDKRVSQANHPPMDTASDAISVSIVEERLLCTSKHVIGPHYDPTSPDVKVSIMLLTPQQLQLAKSVPLPSLKFAFVQAPSAKHTYHFRFNWELLNESILKITTIRTDAYEGWEQDLVVNWSMISEPTTAMSNDNANDTAFAAHTYSTVVQPQSQIYTSHMCAEVPRNANEVGDVSVEMAYNHYSGSRL